MPLLWDILTNAAVRWRRDASIPFDLRAGDLMCIDDALYALVREVAHPGDFAARLPVSDALVRNILDSKADGVAVIEMAGPDGRVQVGLLVRIQNRWCTLDGEKLRISLLQSVPVESTAPPGSPQ
jgi:hypothetical protein